MMHSQPCNRCPSPSVAVWALGRGEGHSSACRRGRDAGRQMSRVWLPWPVQGHVDVREGRLRRARARGRQFHESSEAGGLCRPLTRSPGGEQTSPKWGWERRGQRAARPRACCWEVAGCPGHRQRVGVAGTGCVPGRGAVTRTPLCHRRRFDSVYHGKAAWHCGFGVRRSCR